MTEPLERCAVHNVFHPKGPTCDPTKHGDESPWIEDVIESLEDVRTLENARLDNVSLVNEPLREEWKIMSVRPKTNIPVTCNEEFVGRADVDAEGHIQITLGGSATAERLSAFITSDAVQGISLGGVAHRLAMEDLLKDIGPHSRACGYKRHPHGPDCSQNCPTCGGE